jgi:hypothetical protein
MCSNFIYLTSFAPTLLSASFFFEVTTTAYYHRAKRPTAVSSFLLFRVQTTCISRHTCRPLKLQIILLFHQVGSGLEAQIFDNGLCLLSTHLSSRVIHLHIIANPQSSKQVPPNSAGTMSFSYCSKSSSLVLLGIERID